MTKITLYQIKRAIWDVRKEQICSQILNPGLTEAQYSIKKFENDMADSGLFSPEARHKKRWEYIQRNGIVKHYNGKDVLPFEQYRDLMSKEVREAFDRLQRTATPSLPNVSERVSDTYTIARGRACVHEEVKE